MAAIITEKFRQSNADSFFADLTSSKYYVFVGKSQPWTTEGASADSVPPAPIDSVAPEAYYWDDMLAAKKVEAANISYVIPRRLPMSYKSLTQKLKVMSIHSMPLFAIYTLHI